MIELRYLGVSAVEIRTETGLRLLVDPFITGNAACPVKIEELTNIDLILATHGAVDHLGDTFALMKRTNATLLAGRDVRMLAELKDVDKSRVLSAVYGSLVPFKGLKIKCTYAVHWSRVQMDGPDLGGAAEGYSGPPMGYVIVTEDNTRIYHSGDTALYGDLRLIGRHFRPNIALINVSGVMGYHGYMSPMEAATAVQYLSPDVAIPMHYESGSPDPASFVDHVKVMAPWATAIALEPGAVLRYEPSRVELAS